LDSTGKGFRRVEHAGNFLGSDAVEPSQPFFPIPTVLVPFAPERIIELSVSGKLQLSALGVARCSDLLLEPRNT